MARKAMNLERLTPPNIELAYHIRDNVAPVDGCIKHAIRHGGLLDSEVQDVFCNFRMSPMSDEAVINDVMRMNIPNFDIEFDDILHTSTEHAFSMLFGIKKFPPVHFSALMDYPWKWSKSACLPYINDKKLETQLKERQASGELNNSLKTFGNLKDHIFADCRQKIHNIKDGRGDKSTTYIYDVKAFARAHLVAADDPDKIRFVYGCSKLGIFAEAMFFWPMIEHLHNTIRDHPIAWGYETLSGGFSRIAQKLGDFRQPSSCVCWDWKEFDKRFHFDMFRHIFKYMFEHHIDITHGYLPTWDFPGLSADEGEETDTQQQRLTRLYNWMTRTVLEAIILLPDGSRWRRNFSGMPSGIFATNFLDSINNLICILTILSELGICITDPKRFFIRVMGDDSLMIMSYSLENLGFLDFAKRFDQIASRRFGFISNLKKIDITPSLNGAPFLGYTCRYLLPTRDTVKLLAKLVYPERQTNWERLMARCVGIAWASAGIDPRVHHICKDIYDHLAKRQIIPDHRALDYLEYLIEDYDTISVAEFPTLQEIRKNLIPLTPTIGRSKMNPKSFITSKSVYDQYRSDFQNLYPDTPYPEVLYWFQK